MTPEEFQTAARGVRPTKTITLISRDLGISWSTAFRYWHGKSPIPHSVGLALRHIADQQEETNDVEGTAADDSC